jgi:hypothetical protein
MTRIKWQKRIRRSRILDGKGRFSVEKQKKERKVVDPLDGLASVLEGGSSSERDNGDHDKGRGKAKTKERKVPDFLDGLALVLNG